MSARGDYEPQGMPLAYLSAGSPAVVGNLWDVTDGDIDRFCAALLAGWLPGTAADSSNGSRNGSSGSRNGSSGSNGSSSGERIMGDRTAAAGVPSSLSAAAAGAAAVSASVSAARNACRLPFIVGAAPVCFGVPTVVACGDECEGKKDGR